MRSNFFEEHDRRMKRMFRLFWILFGIVVAIIIGSWTFYGYVALYVLDNPESVGNWFGRLLSGGS